MFENILKFFKKLVKTEKNETNSKNTAKERLHLVLMQDRANVSADFLELMKQEIIEVIKKYIEVEESAIDVRLTNEVKEDGTTGAPSLYANIPIMNIKNEIKKEVNENKDNAQKEVASEKKETVKVEEQKEEKEKKTEKQEEKKETEETTKEESKEVKEENKEVEEDKEKEEKPEEKEDKKSE